MVAIYTDIKEDKTFFIPGIHSFLSIYAINYLRSLTHLIPAGGTRYWRACTDSDGRFLTLKTVMIREVTTVLNDNTAHNKSTCCAVERTSNARATSGLIPAPSQHVFLKNSFLAQSYKLFFPTGPPQCFPSCSSLCSYGSSPPPHPNTQHAANTLEVIYMSYYVHNITCCNLHLQGMDL